MELGGEQTEVRHEKGSQEWSKQRYDIETGACRGTDKKVRHGKWRLEVIRVKTWKGEPGGKQTEVIHEKGSLEWIRQGRH